MPTWLIHLLIKLGATAIDHYITNSSSKVDDKVLEIGKKGFSYLAKKGNNNITQSVADNLKDNYKMREVQKAK